ncbi:MAG TPA: D-aminoacylase [Clostridia bacterium]|nr:D-aminoacylase [Clostridia bacterium]
MYDVVLENGLIVDGTGEKPIRASMGIRGDRITGIGERISGGRRRIDISGLAVTPGFIDIHSHSDGAFLLSERSESKVFQGVTTEVTGSCGISMEPCNIETIADFAKYNSSLFSESGSFEWKFGSVQDYAFELKKKRNTINCVPQVGHGTLRNYAMGLEDRRADNTEMLLMKGKLEEELSQGAWGMSLGLTYAPGSFTPVDELVELAKVIAAHGAILSVHMRSENDGIFNALNEMIEVGKKSGASIQISHLKLMGKPQWGKAGELINMIRKAQADGCRIFCDQYPYEASYTILSALVPKGIFTGAMEEMDKNLNTAKREKLLNEIRNEIERRGNAERIRISNGSEKVAEWEGKSLAQVSGELGISPEEAVIKLLSLSGGNISAIYYSMSEEDVLSIMKEKWIAVGSDGTALDFSNAAGLGKSHPRNFGTFPRVLRLAREKKLLTLEEAVHKMTGLPARIYGIENRGVIDRGHIADLVVFDPERIADTATYEDPIARPVGIHHVFVAGRPVILDGIQQDEYPGRVLLKNFME